MRRVRLAVPLSLTAIAVAVGGAWFFAPVEQPAQQEAARQSDPAVEALVAAIDAESRGVRVVEVSSPQLPPAALRSADRDAAEQVLHPNGAPAPPPGYSFAAADAEPLATLPMLEGEAPPPVPAPADGLDWLAAPDAIRALAQQAAAAERDWTFGWARAAAGTTIEAARASLEAHGAEVLGGAGGLIRARLPGDMERLRALAAAPELSGLGAVPKDRKVAQAFVAETLAAPPGERVPVFVTLMAEDRRGRWRRALEDLGAVVGRFDADIRAYVAHIAAGDLDAVADQDFVLAIEPVGVVSAAHDTAVPAMGADALRRYEGSPGVFTGGGASTPIAVMDTGLNINHLDIATHRASICGANFVIGDPMIEDVDLWVDQNGHGTHVTGTVAGNGYVDPLFAGMAPGVQHIRFAKVLSRHGWGFSTGIYSGMDYLARHSSCPEAGYHAQPAKPLIVNMSLSANSRTWEGRGSSPRKLDAIVWSHRQLYVVAQSNAGPSGFSNYASAKNSLAVGAIGDSGELASFSSHGPTADGRLAPLVVATGRLLDSAQGNGSRSGYAGLSGTSMSSPATAGVAALLLDVAPTHREQPALTRARLMASAIKPDVWLDSPSRFPADNTNGPGELQNLYGLGKVSARTAVLVRDRPDGWTSGSAVAALPNATTTAYRDIDVPENASRLDLVLTWDDPPTETIAQPVLNDLDLHLDLHADCGEGACGERASMSRRDNVEWIIVRNPPAGTHRVKVVPRRVYGPLPRAGLAWKVIRGPSTPTLRLTASETDFDGGSAEDLVLTLTTDGYVASGVRLHVGCSGCWLPAGTRAWRNVLPSATATIAGEDGTFREIESFARGRSIALGEVDAGERQEIRIRFASTPSAAVRVYYVATAWNAEPVVASVLVRGTDDDADAVETVGSITRPTNDRFENRVALDGATGAQPLDMRIAATWPGEPAAGSSRPFGSLWYTWSAPADGLARFYLAAPDYLDIDVFGGDQLADLVRIASPRHGGASFFAAQGESFSIRVSHDFDGATTTLLWAQGPRPSNDDFHAAVALAGDAGEYAGSNLGATLEVGETVGSHAATTWHRWEAPADGGWQFTTDEEVVLVLAFSGSSLSNLRLVSGRPSRWATFPARAGEAYYIAVAASNAYRDAGAYTLTWQAHERTPGADDFANAGEFDGEATSVRVTVDSTPTVEPGEPEETGVRTRWWSWTAPESGRYTWRSDNPELQIAAFASTTMEGLANLDFLGSTGKLAGRMDFVFNAATSSRYFFSAGYPATDGSAFDDFSESATLSWGRTPANDDRAHAALLSGTSGTVTASNEFATAERGERTQQQGHSSLWWAFSALEGEGGWQRFWVEADSDFGITVFRTGGSGFGGLDVVASHAVGWRGAGESGAATFHAEPGVRYLVRVGALRGAGEFTLRWGPAEPPAWLKFAGRVQAPQLGLERVPDDPANLVPDSRAIGGLAIDDYGTTLYAQTQAGLHVLQRDRRTGRLAPLQRIENDLPARALVWDNHRGNLYVEDCGAWHRFAPNYEDRRDLLHAERMETEGPSDCATKLLLGPGGEFVYAVEGGIGVYSIGASNEIRHVQTVEMEEQLKDVALARTGNVLYAATVGDSFLRAYQIGDDGKLVEVAEVDGMNMQAVSLTPDDAFLAGVTANGDTALFDLGGDADELAHLATLPKFENTPSWRDQDGSCSFAAARNDKPAFDAICRNSAFAVAWDADSGELTPTDYVANWQVDRFNNHVPAFLPHRTAASPDGKHLYVASTANEILIFERVGNSLVDTTPPTAGLAVAQGASR